MHKVGVGVYDKEQEKEQR